MRYHLRMSEFGLVGKEWLQMDLRDFSKLALFFEQFPKEARAATAQFLNDFGFAAKANVPTVLAEHMHIRNQRFVASRIRVQKTSALPIDQQRVTVGSIPGDRFTGWIEQQRGAAPERGRVFSLLARGGMETNQATPGYRLKASNKRVDIEDYDDMPGHVTRSRMLQYMLRSLGEGVSIGRSRQRHRRIDFTPMIVHKGYPIRGGLYRIKAMSGFVLPSTGRSAPQIAMLQAFDKQPRPKAWPWIQDVIAYTLKHADIGHMWQQAMNRAWYRMHSRVGA